MTVDESTVRAADPDGMYDYIRAFPEQLRRGIDRGAGISSPCTLEDIDRLLIVGMGGSAISGDLLCALAEPTAPVPISVVRSYTLPGFVDGRTLVVVSSYSGNTAETLAGFEAALQQNAHLFALTSNGRVQERAEQEGIPFHLLPPGMPPRAALGYSLTAVLGLAEDLGLVDLDAEVWNESSDVVAGMAGELDDFSGNEALAAARALADKLPLIYTDSGLLAPVGLRWRCQFEENAKRLAFGNLYPEWNHNEIMGWAGEDAGLLERIGVITLKDRDDHPGVKERMQIVRELIRQKAGAWLEFTTRGEHRLTRMLSLLYLGDWISLYLAVLTGADPMSIDLIELLKSRLSS